MPNTQKTNMSETGLLLRWYDANRRILPWREDPTPYHVWLSEIMLQQTRVEAVKQYYQRFTEILPDIRSLADAPEDLCLKLWEGLGYYSRVRNLHKAARQIMEQYGGIMPASSSELQKLAGIGPYTAAAIASIAFHEKIPAIDGNLLRVFSRRTKYSENIKLPAARKAASAFFGARMPDDRPGDYNQALMDLGACVCLPNGVPDCGSCPWSSCCGAHASKTEQQYPVMPEKRQRRIENRTVLLIRYRDELALRKRPARGLLAGLYEFPNTAGTLTEAEAMEYVRSLGFSPQKIRGLPPAKHVFTHKEWHMTGYEILADGQIPFSPSAKTSPFLATREEILAKYSIPSAFSAYTAWI